jgi:hypothetical protein
MGRTANRESWLTGAWHPPSLETAYDTGGALTGIDYSDTTPDVTLAYDRLGRQARKGARL